MAKTEQVMVFGTQLDDARSATPVKVEASSGMTVVSTVAPPYTGTIPNTAEASPSPAEVYSSGFAVRAVPGIHSVAVHFNAKQFAEQQRVRKLNEAIRRSTQG